MAASPYHAAVRVVPMNEDSDQEQTGPIVIEITIILQHRDVPAADAPLRDVLALPAAAHRHDTLTRREQKVLGLVADGLSNREIAARLVLAEATIKHYVKHVLAKLGVNSRIAAARHPMAQAVHLRHRERHNA